MEGEDGPLVKEVFGKGTLKGKLGNTVSIKQNRKGSSSVHRQ